MASKLKLNAVLVTGCSRGIGLELVKHLSRLALAPPRHIFATCRRPDDAKELLEIAATCPNVHVLDLDVADQSQYPRLVQRVEETLQGEGINALINNAAIIRGDQETLDTVTPDYMLELYNTNTVAPLMLTKALLPALRRASATSSESGLSFSKAGILNVSTKMASLADNDLGCRYGYRTATVIMYSNTVALNMLTKSLAIDLKKDGILAISVNPGWVKTVMGGPNAKITTEQSALGILKIMHEVNEEKSGLFLDWEAGEKIPW